ncbi:MAG: BrnT family toxin [Anaerolineae bacterium]
MKFEWNHRKAVVNLKKHRVSFDEVTTVFSDPLAAIFDDEEHSEIEDREIIVGHSVLSCLLLVCFTERDEQIIRLFSARLATKKEREDYEENAASKI